jgi:parallel beta-helix repeat protein
MKKIFAFLICILFLGLSINVSANLTIIKPASKIKTNGTGETIYVDDDGGKDYTKIQDAIDSASNGDTVYVYSGTYYENIMITKSINLEGENRQNTIIDGDFEDTVVDVQSNYVTISKFTIKNAKHKNWELNGIHLASFCEIKSCDFYQNPWAIKMYNDCNNKITDCNMKNNRYGGILLSYSDNNFISNCESSDSDWGIYLMNNCVNNEISNCKIYNCDNVGLHFYWIRVGTYNVISNCDIYKNKFGVGVDNSPCIKLRDNNIYENTYNLDINGHELSDYYQDIDNSNKINGRPIYYKINKDNLKLYNNNLGFIGLISCSNVVMENIDSYGLLLAGTSSSEINDCKFHDSRKGIELNHNSNNNKIQNCLIYFCSHGIEIYGSASSNNKIMKCDIKNNGYHGLLLRGATKNKIIECNINENGWTGKTVVGFPPAGICLDGSYNNEIKCCNVKNNKEAGIYLTNEKSDKSCKNNLFYHNNFINNKINAYENSLSDNNMDNGEEGNYWDDYKGDDNNGDGIGDTNYNIPGGNDKDRYPLMKPWGKSREKTKNNIINNPLLYNLFYRLIKNLQLILLLK